MSNEIKSVSPNAAPRVAVAQAPASLGQSKGTTEVVKPVEPMPVLESHAATAVAQDAQKFMQNVQAVVEQLNKLSVNTGRGISFSADQKLGVNVITVTNTSTGEVVRTIPTAVAIKVAGGIDDFNGMLAKFKGLLLDEAA